MKPPAQAKVPSSELTCRTTFRGTHEDGKLADKIEREHPNVACEAFSVSDVSPGPVDTSEALFRVLVSPRDIDEDGHVLQAPFEKVFKEGFSVIRSIASREEVFALVADGMVSKFGDPFKEVRDALIATVEGPDGIRSARDEAGERVFGVYDQTVPLRSSEQHVPTHAGIFLRLPPPGTEGRRALQKDYAGLLRELYLKQRPDWESLFDGVLRELNQRAAAGEFAEKGGHQTGG